jgi:hypothetical protein
MDLHKELARDVKCKRERDDALRFLRASYSAAVRGTEWDQLANELKVARESIDPSYGLELYEVEDRGVGVVWPEEGFGSAWVWNGHWASAPGLVNKSWLEGHRLSPAKFQEEFPDADLGALEPLARAAIGGEPEGDRLPSGQSTDAEPLEEDPIDTFQRELLRAVRKWVESRSLEVARRVRRNLRRMPASGIFDGHAHRNLWDEYCLQIQSGPPLLEAAWSATVEPLVDFEVQRLKREDAVLITLLRMWDEDDLSDRVDAETYSPEAVRRSVVSTLAELADQEEQQWVTG